MAVFRIGSVVKDVIRDVVEILTFDPGQIIPDLKSGDILILGNWYAVT